eukprot:8352713-Karenia_brevis.AAC.1
MVVKVSVIPDFRRTKQCTRQYEVQPWDRGEGIRHRLVTCCPQTEAVSERAEVIDKASHLSPPS